MTDISHEMAKLLAKLDTNKETEHFSQPAERKRNY